MKGFRWELVWFSKRRGRMNNGIGNWWVGLRMLEDKVGTVGRYYLVLGFVGCDKVCGFYYKCIGKLVFKIKEF